MKLKKLVALALCVPFGLSLAMSVPKSAEAAVKLGMYHEESVQPEPREKSVEVKPDSPETKRDAVRDDEPIRERCIVRRHRRFAPPPPPPPPPRHFRHHRPAPRPHKFREHRPPKHHEARPHHNARPHNNRPPHRR